jgi:hypothetical protein
MAARITSDMVQIEVADDGGSSQSAAPRRAADVLPQHWRWTPMVDRASAARARSNRISPRGRAAMTRLELITSTLPASAGVAATREYQAVDCFEILCGLHGSSLPAPTREQVAAIAPHAQLFNIGADRDLGQVMAL